MPSNLHISITTLNTRLTAIFQKKKTWVSWYQNVSILDFIGDKDDGLEIRMMWLQWQLKLLNRAKLQSNQTPTNQHPTCYRPDALPVAQPAVSKHWREKISHSMDLLTPSSPRSLPTLSSPVKARYSGYLVEGCQASHQPWCQYPKPTAFK